MLPFAQDFIQLAIRTNLMLFYFEGKQCAIDCKILFPFIYMIEDLRASGLWVFCRRVKSLKPKISLFHILIDDHFKLMKPEVIVIWLANGNAWTGPSKIRLIISYLT
jgi:hypothetical protein